MKALAVLLALATTAHAGAFVPPKLYAAMFEKGHRWTFDVTTKVQMSDGATFSGRLETRNPGKPNAHAKSNAKPELVAV